LYKLQFVCANFFVSAGIQTHVHADLLYVAMIPDHLSRQSRPSLLSYLCPIGDEKGSYLVSLILLGYGLEHLENAVRMCSSSISTSPAADVAHTSYGSCLATSNCNLRILLQPKRKCLQCMASNLFLATGCFPISLSRGKHPQCLARSGIPLLCDVRNGRLKKNMCVYLSCTILFTF
jgi:hypothetical protein